MGATLGILLLSMLLHGSAAIRPDSLLRGGDSQPWSDVAMSSAADRHLLAKPWAAVADVPQENPQPSPHPAPQTTPTPVPAAAAPVASPPPSLPPVESSPPPPTSSPPPPPTSSPPPPPTSSPPPPVPTPSPTFNGGCPDAALTLDTINSVRARFGAAPVTWNTDIAASAKAYADQCVFQHSGTPNLGETLMKGGALSLQYTQTPCSWSAGYSGWAGEYVNWPGGNDFVYAAGHFTQLVWKSTTEVGCGYSDCGGDSYVVCQWYPPGNMAGAYDQNVGAPLWR